MTQDGFDAVADSHRSWCPRYPARMFEGLMAPTHLFVLLAVVVLLFGSKRIPEVGRSLGAGFRGFHEGVTGTPPRDEPAPEPTGRESQ